LKSISAIEWITNWSISGHFLLRMFFEQTNAEIVRIHRGITIKKS
jgi:hypothetical protein